MKRLWALLLALALLAGCAPAAVEDGKTHILCTTYPVYLFTTAVTQGVEDVEVELLVNQQTSCLHNYTLTVRDMQAIDRADIIVMNGAGLENFMADALAQKDVPVIDCSESIDLLPALDHHHHEDEDEHEVDPHYWMDPSIKVPQALENISSQLSEWDTPHAALYQVNLAVALQTLEPLQQRAKDQWLEMHERWMEGARPYLERPQTNYMPSFLPYCPKFITFHDGFQYFALTFQLDLLKSIEEEEGAEASARELMEVIELVEGYDIPAIFVEKNGSRRSADVIARETGCKVVELDMIMSGDGQGIEPYIQAMEHNLDAVKEALS